MATLMIDGICWHSSGSMHYNKKDAIKIRDTCRKRGVRARIIERHHGTDRFWMIYVNKDVNWLCDVDRAYGE